MKLLNSLSRIFNRNTLGENKHVTEALDNSLDIVAKDVKLLDREYIINQATGEWLDEWGSWFGIRRLANETDESYGNRIVAIVANPKSTIPAITDSIRSYLGPDSFVHVYEPFNDIFKFGSSFSTTHRFQDATYYRMGVIDISVESEITKELIDTLNKIKAGGVKIYFTRTIQLPLLEIKAPDEVASRYEMEIEYNMLVYPSTSMARYSDSLPNQPMSGSQTIFSSREKYVDLTASAVSDLIYMGDREREITLLVNYLQGQTYSGRDIELDLPMVSIASNNSNRHTEKETQLEAVMARMILAGSEIVINDILDYTIDELMSHRIEVVEPIVSESIPI